MVNLGFCRPCFKAGLGRVDAARMHHGDAYCLPCLKAAGVEVLAPPAPAVKVQAPLRRVVAKTPAVTFPARVKPDATPLVKAVVDARSAGGARKTTVKMLPAKDDGMCRLGCGKARHRGLCAGQKARKCSDLVEQFGSPPESETLESLRGMVAKVFPEVYADKNNELTVGFKALQVREEARMDKLVAEYVRVEDVPGEARPVRKATGRMGELWLMLERAPAETPRVKVKCADVKHAGYTSRQLRAKAEKLGRSVVVQRSGTDLYCWLEGGAA